MIKKNTCLSLLFVALTMPLTLISASTYDDDDMMDICDGCYIETDYSSGLLRRNNTEESEMAEFEPYLPLACVEDNPRSKQQRLLESIKVGDVNAVKRLIEAGASLDYVYNSGNNPLMEAALLGHEDVCNLIKKHAKALSVDQQNYLVQMSGDRTLSSKSDNIKRKNIIKQLVTLRPSARQCLLEAEQAKRGRRAQRSSIERKKEFIISTQNQLLYTIMTQDYQGAKKIIGQVLDFHNYRNILDYIFAIPRFLETDKVRILITPLSLAALMRDESMIIVLLGAGSSLPNPGMTPDNCMPLIEKHKHRAVIFKEYWKNIVRERTERRNLIAEIRKRDVVKKSYDIVEAYEKYVHKGSAGSPPYNKERVAYAIHYIHKYDQVDLTGLFENVPELQ